MDPLSILVTKKDSFSYPQKPVKVGSQDQSNLYQPVDIAKLLPEPYINKNWVNPDKRIETVKKSAIGKYADPNDTYTNVAQYRRLQKKKDALCKYSRDDLSSARAASNAFEEIGNSIFCSRAAIKLANCDIYYNLTGQKYNFLNKTSNGPFSFCDIAAGPGSFTQYIQWRRTDAQGFGMTLKDVKGLDWDLSKIDTSRFIPVYGEDETGDLYINWHILVSKVHDDYPDGVDLVTGDGGFDIESTKDYQHEEFLNLRLFSVQLLTSIAILTAGGNACIKLFDSVTTMMSQLLFIASLAFEKIVLFKPLSSRPANSERYLICLNKIDNQKRIQSLIDLLTEVNESYDNRAVINIFANQLPDDFVIWLRKNNDIFLERQELAVDQFLQNLELLKKGKELVKESDKYDIYKILIYLTLPENIK